MLNKFSAKSRSIAYCHRLAQITQPTRGTPYCQLMIECVGVFELLTGVRGQLGKAADPLYRHHMDAMATQAKKVQMGIFVSGDEKDGD